MEITIPYNILKNVEKASQELGLTREEVVAKAVLLYLKNLKEFEALSSEINQWEEVSINDSNNFLEKNEL